MIDLVRVHAIMKDKGYHYFCGMTNKRDGYFQIEFSTLPGSRGDSLELMVFNDDKTSVRWWYGYEEKLRLEMVSEEEMLSNINNIL